MFAELSLSFSDIFEHPGQVYPSVLTVVLLGTAALVVLHLVLSLIGGRAKRPRPPFSWRDVTETTVTFWPLLGQPRTLLLSLQPLCTIRPTTH